MDTVTQSEQRVKAAVDALAADPKHPKLNAEYIITMRNNYKAEAGEDAIHTNIYILVSIGVLVDHGDLDLINHALAGKDGYDDPNSNIVRMAFTQTMFKSERILQHLSTKWNNGVISKYCMNCIKNYYIDALEEQIECRDADDNEFLQNAKYTRKIIDKLMTLDP